MTPKDSYFKHPVATMINASRENGRLTRLNHIVRSDNFDLTRQCILINRHKGDLMENKNRPCNYVSYTAWRNV